MLTRRQLPHIVAFLSLWVRSRRAWSNDGIDWAADFIRQIGNEIADITASGAPTNERRQRLQSLVDRAADVEGAARFCLGRFWRKASPAQQGEYVGLFHTILMKVVLAHINAESQVRTTVRVTIGRPELRQDSVFVPTVVERSGNPPIQVAWVVSTDSLHPRLIDVVAEGTSLRLTIRNDYSAFLMHHDDNIDALLQALREQACSDCGTATLPAAR
jgi:phospholipid transport system substrate-binding protein